MGAVNTHLPVQPLLGVIFHPAEDPVSLRDAISGAFGEVGFESPVWPFDFTDYYEREMGTGLKRQFLVLRDLAPVEGLHRMKTASNDLEARLAAASSAGAERPVNIDPGYICHAKLVLWSTKDFSHRIYIADGIFAEITLEWKGGAFQPHPWTFPDYRSGNYRNFLADARVKYIEKLKGNGTTCI